MPITHAFVSGKSDGGDTTLVRPSNWNADHDLSDFDAADVPIVDSGGNFTSGHVEGALAELAEAGGGAALTPARVQTNAINTSATNPAITIAAAAEGNLLILSTAFTGRDIDSVTCTNVTWTHIRTYSGAQYNEIWVGKVSGGSSGTTITMNTSSNNYASATVMEIEDPGVTPALGTNYVERATFNGTTDIERVDGFTPGEFYVAMFSAPNTSLVGMCWGSHGLAPANPNGCGLVVGFVPSGGSFDIFAMSYAGGGTGNFLACEIA